jgi:uncharacterized oxidoreductase
MCQAWAYSNDSQDVLQEKRFMRLTGNTILITGGTSGIGRALAEALHRRGNQLIIAGRRQHLLDEITAAHAGMRGMQLNVEDSGDVDASAAFIRDQFPELNVLINNAGVSRPEDLTAETVDISVAKSIVRTNIVGGWHCNRQEARRAKNPDGAVVERPDIAVSQQGARSRVDSRVSPQCLPHRRRV